MGGWGLGRACVHVLRTVIIYIYIYIYIYTCICLLPHCVYNFVWNFDSCKCKASHPNRMTKHAGALSCEASPSERL